METYDYHGWHIKHNDTLYKRFITEKKNVVREEEEQLKNKVYHLCNGTRLAVEVGCHYGFSTKALSKHFNIVHSFDFDNDIFSCCQMNMKKFKCKNVILHPYGLGNKEENVAIKDERGPLSNAVDPAGNDKKFKIKTLDSMQLDNCDLITIDTEGYECKVLEGATQTIKKFMPVIVAEFHRRDCGVKFGYSNNILHQTLERLGYRFYQNLTKHDRVYTPNSL